MFRRALIVLATLFLSATSLAAQELTGRIEGNVTDPSEAVISGASVTATHKATNTVYRATTNATGRFLISGVRLGRYDIAVEAQGFRRAVVPDAVVEVGATASVNVQLQIGALAEEVVVTGGQQIINTVDAELATVVDERRVLELPLNGRNASHLILLQAGVYFERTSDGEGDKLIVHGQRHRSVNISLDGVDTQDNLNRASSIMLDQPLIHLAAENVQEFRVATGNTSAEFSRGGIQVSAVTRSGSNEWHGSLFWFHRNTVFNANEFFNNSAGVEKAPLIRNQFGGRIGGPIFKDKTFVFFGYEQTRESRGIPVNRTVYTAEARMGIFRYIDSIGDLRTTPETVAANPGLIRSVNLLECSANVQAILGRDCVDSRFDNALPASVDPFFQNTVFPALPLPNSFVFGDGLNTGTFRFNSSSKTAQHLPAFRLDHRFNDKHTYFGTINYTDRNIAGDFINGREVRFPALEPLGFRVTHSRSFTSGLASALSPSFSNEFRFGMVSGENAFIRNQPFDTPQFTMQFNEVSDPYEPGGDNSVRDNETWHLRNTSTWVKGTHTLKFGGEWRHRYLDNYSFFERVSELHFDDDDNPPGFTEANLRAMSTGGPVTDIDSTDLEAIGDTMNDLVGALGLIEISYNVTSLNSGFVLGVPERRKYQTRELDLFFNDTWQMHPRFTVNLGLRWEFATVPFETQGLLLLPEGTEEAVFGVSGREGFFNPSVFAGPTCRDTFPFDLSALSLAPTTANAINMIESCATQYVPGGSNNGRRLWNNDYNNFGPVISLAWDPWGDGKTALRAGYRISYMQDHFAIIDGNVDDNEGLQVGNECVVDPSSGVPCDTTPTAPFLLRDVMSAPPMPLVPPFVLPSVRSFLDSTTQDFRTYANDLGTPYYQEWNFGIQREFWGNSVIELRYVANRGLGLRRVADFNEYNVLALDPVTGMTFLDAYLLAQQNLACNRANGAGNRFDTLAFACSMANPLMDALIAGEPARLRGNSSLVSALDFNETGDFARDLIHNVTSRPMASQPRMRGGSFWGQVLAGRFPANFFIANPFIASARRMANDGFSDYHGLEVEVRRRLSGGLMFQTNYTFAKALADFDGDANELLNDVRPSSVRNPQYNRQEIMPRHIFSANWIYELPFGRGRRWAPQNSSWNKWVGGWQTAGIVSIRSGRPISITSSVGTFHRTAISGQNTVNLLQPLSRDDLRGMTGTRNIGASLFWFDPCLSFFNAPLGACNDPNATPGLFQLPNPGELGELQLTPIFGPSRFTLDFSLAKNIPITETVSLEFRWEVFNLTNTTNFNIPITDIFNRSFGEITSTITTPRLMQFAFKINF